MARPKSNAPKKVHLNLTVTEQTKIELAYLAAQNKKSVSELVAEWASREARRATKRTGVALPSPEQLTIDAQTENS